MVTMGLALAGPARVGAIGVVISLLAALALTRLMTSLLYAVQPTDPAIFTSVAILVLLVALTAAYVSARRAARVYPAVSLTYE